MDHATTLATELLEAAEAHDRGEMSKAELNTFEEIIVQRAKILGVNVAEIAEVLFAMAERDYGSTTGQPGVPPTIH